jgi:hypothetical protein
MIFNILHPSFKKQLFVGGLTTQNRKPKDEQNGPITGGEGQSIETGSTGYTRR